MCPTDSATRKSRNRKRETRQPSPKARRPRPDAACWHPEPRRAAVRILKTKGAPRRAGAAQSADSDAGVVHGTRDASRRPSSGRGPRRPRPARPVWPRQTAARAIPQRRVNAGHRRPACACRSWIRPHQPARRRAVGARPAPTAAGTTTFAWQVGPAQRW